MKLLITTQIMDKDHHILGFFHQWVMEFARHCEEVHVICLKEGRHDLPENVYVYSLGKEEGVSRIKYLWRFYKYIWKLRKNYDSVFVHMNQIYIILGWLSWRIQRKTIGLWYMHRAVTPSLRMAEKLTDYIFTASKESFRIPSKKLIITGHGIDAERFTPRTVFEKSIDLLTIGRMTKSKNMEELVEVLDKLRSQGQILTLSIVGAPMIEAEVQYERELKALIEKKDLTKQVNFLGAIKHENLPDLLAKTKIFVHAATNGSLDKTLLEPLLMEVPVVTSAEGAASLPLGSWHVSGVDEFTEIIVEILQSDTSERSNELRMFVEKNHSVGPLIPKILKTLDSD